MTVRGSPGLTAREPLRPVLYDESSDAVRLLDQRLLPAEETWLALRDADGVADAIRTLAVRGAPAIGVAAAYALACDIAAIDRSATQEELRLLEMIRDRLSIERLVAAAIERGVRARNAVL